MLLYSSIIKSSTKTLLLVLGVALGLSGCKVGEDDPAISFRSRDARLKANWKLSSAQTNYEIRTLDPAGQPVKININSDYDGYDMHVITKVNETVVSDSVFGYSYQMKIEDKGKVTYEYTIIYQNLAGVKSPGTDNWYWLNTDEEKSRVYLGSTLLGPLTAGFPSLPNNQNLPLAAQITDFNVDGLKNKELHLTYNKSLSQSSIIGFQQVNASTKLNFVSR
jgi:hypothetical protein